MQKEIENEVKVKDKSMDFVLLIVTIILLCIGLLMVSSASSYFSLTQKGNSSYFLIRQFGFAVVGVFLMLVISKIDYRRYAKIAYIGYFASLGLMLLVLIPGIGGSIKGANRWIDFGFISFQPSELMKVALIIALSTYIVNNFKKMNTLKGYIVPGIMLVGVIVALFIQKHMSGMVIMFLISLVVVYISGIKVKPIYLIATALAVSLVIYIFVSTEEFRMKRITSFFNPEADITGDSWQASQSLYALGSGGIFGKGLGQSRQKYLWLPEAQNDFVFSILGEELGAVGAIIVVGLFTIFIYRGIIIGVRSNDMYAVLLACRNNINVCISGNYKHCGCNIQYACNRYAITIF